MPPPAQRFLAIQKIPALKTTNINSGSSLLLMSPSSLVNPKSLNKTLQTISLTLLQRVINLQKIRISKQRSQRSPKIGKKRWRCKDKLVLLQIKMGLTSRQVQNRFRISPFHEMEKQSTYGLFPLIDFTINTNSEKNIKKKS